MSDRSPYTERVRRGLAPSVGETTLGEVAEVRSGYTFRSGVTDDPNGDVRVLQLGDIDRSGSFDPDTLARADFGERAGKHRLHVGDVLLTARGERIVVLRVPVHEGIVAAAGLLVIRPRPSLDSAYLLWYLRHPRAFRRLERLREGSNLRFLEKRGVALLPIAVPALAVQRDIAERYAAHARRCELRLALNALDEHLVDETAWREVQRCIATVAPIQDGDAET